MKNINIENELEKHLNRLMELFDSVIIIATEHNSKENSTEMRWRARGNHYANECAVREWISSRTNNVKNHHEC